MCASIALPKLLLLLSEPGRLYKVHLEFLTSLLWLSSHRQSYTWTKKIFFLFLPHTVFFCPSVPDFLTHSYSFAQSHCPQCFQFLFLYSVLAEPLTALRQEKNRRRLLTQELMLHIGQRLAVNTCFCTHTYCFLLFTHLHSCQLLLLCLSCFHINVLCVPTCVCVVVFHWLLTVATEAVDGLNLRWIHQHVPLTDLSDLLFTCAVVWVCFKVLLCVLTVVSQLLVGRTEITCSTWDPDQHYTLLLNTHTRSCGSNMGSMPDPLLL